MATDHLDTSKFAAAVRAKRGEAGLRLAAEKIGKTSGKISAATLSRIEQGKAPDVDTFLLICKWLGTDPSEFSASDSSRSTQKKGTMELIEAHLRADKTLSSDTADTLVDMIRMVYRQAHKK